MKEPFEILLGNREKFLKDRPVLSIAASLGGLSRRWLDKKYFFRQKALRWLVEKGGFSDASAEALLDALFGGLLEANLRRLLQTELGDPLVLDGFRRDPVAGVKRRAFGPALTTHIFSGNIPNPAIVSLVLGMLLKSANIGKPSSENGGFPGFFLESLRAHDAKLASTNLLLGPSDRQTLRRSVERSDVVVAYGSDDTIRRVRKTVPARAFFFGYGHRVSFSLYTQGAMRPARVQELARNAARDIWMADRNGCLSPLWIFIGADSEAGLLGFARRLKQELDRDGKGKWLVAYDRKLSPLSPPRSNRVVCLKGFKKIKDVLDAIRPMRKWLQCVSLEASGDEREAIAGQLSAAGVNRICRAGRMQDPPLTWHHDGKPNLAGWVKWTDWED